MDLSSRVKEDVPNSHLLNVFLKESSSQHDHLCPRQVLGVRIGLKGLQVLGLIDSSYQPRFSNHDKRLITISETDGCGSDGLAAATDCSVGKRTLRVIDFGKVAATLIETESEAAVRIAPSSAARDLATTCQPDAESRWHAYLKAYQVLPDNVLLEIQRVRLNRSLAEILSKPDARAICEICSEEIFNERETTSLGRILCKSCAGESYYSLL